jgi:hypothetical protein
MVSAAGRWRALDPRRWPAPLLAALPVAAIALALYLRTLLPGVGLWDTAEFQTVGPVLGIAHPTGYPTYTLLAWAAAVLLQPAGDEALRANLLSALLVAAACGVVAGVTTVLSQRLSAGIIGGLVLAVAPAAWSVGQRADPHALHLLLMALIVALLVGWVERRRRGAPADRWLLGAALVYGVSLGNHALTVLLAPSIALLLLLFAPDLRHRPRFVLGCFLAAVLPALALYAYLPLRSAMDPPLDYANPETLDGLLYVVLGAQFSDNLHAPPALAEIVRLVAGTTWAQLAPLAVLAPLGLAVLGLRRPALAVLLGGWSVLTWLFALSYVDADIGRYHLGPLLVVALLVGLGAGGLIDGLTRLAARVTGGGAVGCARVTRFPGLAAGLAAVLLAGGALAVVPARFDGLDRSQNTLARTWLETTLAELAPDAVVVAWWSYATTLRYGQFVEGRRNDVLVLDDQAIIDRGLGSVAGAIDHYLGTRPVYVIRFDAEMAQLEQRYLLRAVTASQLSDGRMYLLDGRRDDG